MSVKQISVFLETTTDGLMQFSKVLQENNIDIRAFSIAEAQDFSIARVIVDDFFCIHGGYRIRVRHFYRKGNPAEAHSITIPRFLRICVSFGVKSFLAGNVCMFTGEQSCVDYIDNIFVFHHSIRRNLFPLSGSVFCFRLLRIFGTLLEKRHCRRSDRHPGRFHR